MDWGGILSTAQMLRQRGHQVAWVSGKAIQPHVTQAGLTFIEVKKTGWRWPPPPPIKWDRESEQ